MGPNINSAVFYALLPNGERVKVGKLTGITELEDSEGLKIRKVIFSGPATIVFWNDGDKTVVKCMEGDHMNYGMGIAMCTLKKLFGDRYGYFKQDLKKWTPEQKESEGEPWHIIVNTEDSKKIAKNPQKFADAFGEFLQKWDKEIKS